MKIIPTSIAVCTLSALLLCTAPVSATPLQGDHIPTGFPVLPRPQICQTVYFDKAPLYPEVAGFINGLLYPKIEGWSDPQSLNLVTYNGSDAAPAIFTRLTLITLYHLILRQVAWIRAMVRVVLPAHPPY